jgi:4-hydroxy-tetrahydrodipicolinate synthase
MAVASRGADALGRVVTAMVTPFLDDGALDVAGAAHLARHLVATGSDGLVLGGTTGESPTLRDEELWRLVEAVRDAVPTSVRITVGTGTNDTARTIERTVRAAATGADGILVVTPYYNRPSQPGLVAHFTAVAQATDLPVLLYDVPARTGRAIAVPTLITLSEVPNIVGVKDATGDLGKAGDVIAATRAAPGGFDVWSGADEVNLPLLALGAVGIVSVSAHLVGVELAEMVHVFTSDPVRARQLHLTCLPLHRALFLDPNPGPLKAALAARGLPAGGLRGPLVASAPEVTATVIAALEAVEAHRAA